MMMVYWCGDDDDDYDRVQVVGKNVGNRIRSKARKSNNGRVSSSSPRTRLQLQTQSRPAVVMMMMVMVMVTMTMIMLMMVINMMLLAKYNCKNQFCAVTIRMI